MSRLAFVDDPARLEEVPDGFELVALEPRVALAAPHATQLDAHVDDLELEELGERTYERVEALVAVLDAARPGPGTAEWRFQELKELYDHTLALTLGAQRLAQASSAGSALVLADRGTRAAFALPAALARLGVEVRSELRDLPSAPVAPYPRLLTVRTQLRLAARRRRPRIFCLDEAYNLVSVLPELRARGADALPWLPPPGRRRRVPALDASRFAPLLAFAGIDLAPALGPELVRLASGGLTADEARYHAAMHALRAHRPDLLVASSFASPAAKAAASAARTLGIPSVVIRHGELGIRELPVMRFNDLDVVDHALCWGRWEAEFIARHALRPVETRIVGSPMIEAGGRSAVPRAEARRRHGIGDDEPVVLFAPTSLSADGWYAGHRVPLDLSYARHANMVLDELRTLDDWRVLVKEHPSGRRFLRQGAARFVEQPFAEVVDLADVLVLDFPSTTLAQALQGSSRIVVVRHPVTEYEPGVVEHLERYGVRFTDPAGLAGVVRSELGETVDYPQEAIEPLVASGVGTAAERAADALVELARRR